MIFLRFCQSILLDIIDKIVNTNLDFLIYLHIFSRTNIENKNKSNIICLEIQIFEISYNTFKQVIYN